MCGPREVERPRDTDRHWLPNLCHRNHTSLLAAAELRSLRGWGSSSCFGQAQPDSRECSFSLSSVGSGSKRTCGHTTPWKVLLQQHSRLASKCSHPCHHGLRGLSLLPMANRGWWRDEKCLICIPLVRRDRKGHLVLPFNHAQNEVPAVPSQAAGAEEV